MTQFLDDAPVARAQGSRVPPHNLAAEESLIGAMLLSPEAIMTAMEVLNPEDFYRPLHGQIFAAVVDLSNSGREVDSITVTQKLEERGLPKLEMSVLAAMQINTLGGQRSSVRRDRPRHVSSAQAHRDRR
jgi:hypothetical protein